jgi:hypothetical protein
MNPWECSECPNTIVWEGYDPEVHERLCGNCLFLIRKGEERERDRILAMKKDIINCVIDYGLTPEKYERVCNDIDALIKGEK